MKLIRHIAPVSAASLAAFAITPVVSAALFDFAPGATGYPFNPVGNVNTGVGNFNQTVDGMTLTASASGGNISANNQSVGTGIVGIGVVGNGGTAINASGGESITVTFDTDVLLEQIVLDGHANPDSAGVTLPGTGLFSVIGANTVNGNPPAGVTFLSLNGGDQTVDDTITFGTPVQIDAGETVVFNNVGGGGYFIRSITVAAVPEPGSLALLGLGVAAVAVRRSRRA
ncbi:MAG: PEP-CTERM sorting domain-containing protein [Planctomycetota bacterium]